MPTQCITYIIGETAPLRRMSSDRGYRLRLITVQDKEEVISFLRRFFFQDEPLNICTGMDLDYKSGKVCPELEGYCTDGISEGTSIMAVAHTGEIVGVCLNGTMARDDPDEEEFCKNNKFRRVLNLLSATEKQLGLFDRYPKLNKVLDIKIISVDSSWRGKGICRAFFEKSKDVAKELNYQMVKADCTSHISALIVAKVKGFERIHMLKYSEHFEEGETEPAFSPPPPHEGVQVYVWKADDDFEL